MLRLPQHLLRADAGRRLSRPVAEPPRGSTSELNLEAPLFTRLQLYRFHYPANEVLGAAVRFVRRHSTSKGDPSRRPVPRLHPPATRGILVLLGEFRNLSPLAIRRTRGAAGESGCTPSDP